MVKTIVCAARSHRWFSTVNLDSRIASPLSTYTRIAVAHMFYYDYTILSLFGILKLILWYSRYKIS